MSRRKRKTGFGNTADVLARMTRSDKLNMLRCWLNREIELPQPPVTRGQDLGLAGQDLD